MLQGQTAKRSSRHSDAYLPTLGRFRVELSRACSTQPGCIEASSPAISQRTMSTLAVSSDEKVLLVQHAPCWHPIAYPAAYNFRQWPFGRLSAGRLAGRSCLVAFSPRGILSARGVSMWNTRMMPVPTPTCALVCAMVTCRPAAAHAMHDKHTSQWPCSSCYPCYPVRALQIDGCSQRCL